MQVASLNSTSAARGRDAAQLCVKTSALGSFRLADDTPGIAGREKRCQIRQSRFCSAVHQHHFELDFIFDRTPADSEERNFRLELA
jgi:hypothetical protein